jgi:hypothetical protein
MTNKLEQCCQDLADCCDRQDFDGAVDALKECKDACEADCQPHKKHGAAQPADLTACEQKLNQASQRVNSAKAQSAGAGQAQKVGFAISPTVWTALIQVGIMLLQELASRRNNATP